MYCTDVPCARREGLLRACADAGVTPKLFAQVVTPCRVGYEQFRLMMLEHRFVQEHRPPAQDQACSELGSL
jgi:hypothetical protein